MAWKQESVTVGDKSHDVMVKYVGGEPISVELAAKPERPAKIKVGSASFMAGTPRQAGDIWQVPLVKEGVPIEAPKKAKA